MARIRLPAALIHLTGILRPHLLRPDLKVPDISYIDFKGLRRVGFNAVVVDKDNCLTLPEKDELYAPYTTAWQSLLRAFEPGRVLVVSNSAGTKKDPGGIAAEHVALQLQCPVLLHSSPKPACADLILQYFKGQLGKPKTTSAEILLRARRDLAEEDNDKKALIGKWLKEVDGPLAGPLKDETGQVIKVEEALVPRKRASPVSSSSGSTLITTDPLGTIGAPLSTTSASASLPPKPDEPLRLLVIGDRLFTDTLLAHRLRLYFGGQQSDSVISIYTTSLPQPNDVRLLRWIENRLSRGKLRESRQDWSKYMIDPNGQILSGDSLATLQAGRRSWIDPGPPLTWNPKSWKLRPLLFGLYRLSRYSIISLGRGSVAGVKWIWARARRRTSTVPALEGVPGIEQVVTGDKIKAG